MRRFLCVVATVFSFALVTMVSWGLAQVAATDAATADPLAPARAALLRQDGPAALAILDPLVTADPTRADARMLRAFARLVVKDDVGALADFAAVAERAPASPAGLEARFARADLFARAGKLADAAAQTAEGVTILRSDARRHEFVSLYLATADTFLHPKAETAGASAPEPNPANALILLQRAEELGSLGDDAARVAIDILRCLHASKQDPTQVVRRARALRAKFPEHKDAAEAAFIEGHAQAQLDQQGAAVVAWRRAADSTDAAFGAKALDALARWALTRKNASAFALAADAASDALERFPKDSLTAPLVLDVAQTLGADENARARGVSLVDAFIAAFPEHARFAEASLFRAKLAEDTDIQDAIARYAAFLAARPADLQSRAAAEAITALRFTAADLATQRALIVVAAERADAAAIARERWNTFLTSAPLDARVPTALLALGSLDAAEDKIDDALARYAEIRRRFPGVEAAIEGALRSATLLAEKRGAFDAAFAVINEIPAGTSLAPRIAGFLAKYKSEELMLDSAVLAPGARPELMLHLRNLEHASISLYRVRIDDMFAANGDLRSLDTIDVSLIKPDRSFEVAAEGYAPYRRFDVRVPLAGETALGALVVTARSNTREARAVALVSGTAFAAVVSHSGIDTFAFDRATGGALDGVTIAAAFDGVAAPAGVLEPPKPGVGCIGMLARAASGPAFAWGASLNALPAPRVDVPAGALFAESTTYRPGDTIHVAGLVRDAENGVARAFTSDAALYLMWVDAATGATLARTRVAPTPDGLVHGSFTLPRGATAQRSVLCHLQHDVQGAVPATFDSVTFDVQAFASTTTSVVVEPLDPAGPKLTPGGSARFVARIRAPSGEPIAREEVWVTLAQNDAVRFLSDALGRVAFVVDGELTARAGTIPVQVRVLGETTSHQILVRADETEWAFAGDATDLAVAGEPFTLSLLAFTDDDRPAAGAKAHLVVRATGIVGRDEPPVEQDVIADAEGRVRASFTLKRAGLHVARVAWTDADGSVRSASFNLESIGNTDAAEPGALRVIVRELRPEAGATANLRVLSTLDDGPAWVLVHARRRTHSAAITLKRGWNDVTVPMPGLPAADCRVTVLAARAGVGFRATVDIAFAAPLRLDLAVPDAATANRAVLQVKDGGGRPLAADVSLWLVAADRAPDLADATDAQSDRWLDAAAGAARVLASDDFQFPSSTGTVDAQVELALNEIASVAANDAAPVLVDELKLESLVDNPLMPGEKALEMRELGAGGGLGKGKYGSRAAKGGRGRTVDAEKKDRANANPFYAAALARRLDARTDAEGRLTWDLPTFDVAGSYAVVAIASAGPARIASVMKTFAVRHDVDVRVVAPASLAVDDHARVAVDLENRTAATRTVEVALETTLAQTSVRRSVTLEPFAGSRLALELPALTPGDGKLVVRVGDRTFERALTVRPTGVPQVVAVAATDAVERAMLTLPAGTPIAAAELVVDSSAAAALLSLAEESDSDDIPGDLRAASLRLLTAAEALIASNAAGADAEPRRASVRVRAQERIDRLAWWSDDAAAFEPLLGVALARAKSAGLTVPDRLRSAFDERLAARMQAATDDAEQAWLLFCRGSITEQDFGRVNRLLRAKAQGDAATLAPLAVALARSGRTAEATDVFAELRIRFAPGRAAPAPDPLAILTWNEICALALDARRTLHANADEVESFAAALEQGATTAIDARLARVLALRSEPVAPVATEAMFNVQAGGAVIASVTDVPACRSVRVLVSADVLARGLETVRTGLARGARARLTQLRAVPLESLPAVDVKAGVRMMRQIELRDGVRVASGDSIVMSDRRMLDWKIPVTLAPARTVALALMLDYSDALTRDAWWFVPRVEGLTFDVTYGAARVLHDDRGTWIFVRRTSSRDTYPNLQVAMSAAQPGTYALPSFILGRAPGTLAARPTMNGPTTLTTDAAADGDDGPAWTPDERFNAGKAAFARNELAHARELLRPLADLALEPTPLLETNRMLLLCAVAANDVAEQVRFFEVAKERDPDFVVPFDATVKVGAAYRELGEFERSRQVYLAVADAGFLEEAQIVGAFEQVGKKRAATEIMSRLLLEIPDTDLARQTSFALAQQATELARATDAAADGSDDPKRKELAAFLWSTAVATLEHRAIEAPAAADIAEVLLTLADVHRERHAYAASDAVSLAALARKDLGRLAPAFQYERAFAALAEKRLDDALAAARVLADAEKAFPGDEAVKRLAAQGRHLEAQILQVKGDFDGARKAYALVKDRFDDAARELDFLERSALEVAELTTVKTGEPLRIEAKIHGAAKTVDVLAYKVDLRLLYLKQRGFEHLRDVQLAGLPPFRTFSIPVPAGSAAAVRLDLDLPDAGAYLLDFRAGEQQARALAIRSDLALDVRDDEPTRVRVHVWRADTGARADGATITFFGAGSGRFITRKADLRGVAEVEGLAGRVALVAELDGHYAFSQGAVEHGVAQRDEDRRKAQGLTAGQVEEERSAQVELLNDAQYRNAATWKENTNRRQAGVEVQRAKK